MVLPENPEKLPLRRAYPFLAEHGLGEQSEGIQFSPEYFGGYSSTLKRAKVVVLLKERGLLDEFISAAWSNGNTQKGASHIRFLEGLYERFTNDRPDEDDEEPEEEVEEGRFAAESDLRDYLVRNLHRLEAGLSPWSSPDLPIEFPADDRGRRIDILARDSAGVPVVIELKVHRGHERTIGQALYYRGQMKDRLAVPRVRIVIVAREITPELRIAARDLADVDLFEYRLTMDVNKVEL